MLKAGDIVVAKKRFGLQDRGKVGQAGIVTFVPEKLPHIGVRWENFEDGHDGDDRPGYPKKSCWFFHERDLEVFNENLENK